MSSIEHELSSTCCTHFHIAAAMMGIALLIHYPAIMTVLIDIILCGVAQIILTVYLGVFVFAALGTAEAFAGESFMKVLHPLVYFFLLLLTYIECVKPVFESFIIIISHFSSSFFQFKKKEKGWTERNYLVSYLFCPGGADPAGFSFRGAP